MTKTAADTELLTTAQAAKRAGVTRRTITRWALDGRLAPAFRPDTQTGALLFRASDVDAATAKPGD